MLCPLLTPGLLVICTPSLFTLSSSATLAILHASDEFLPTSLFLTPESPPQNFPESSPRACTVLGPRLLGVTLHESRRSQMSRRCFTKASSPFGSSLAILRRLSLKSLGPIYFTPPPLASNLPSTLLEVNKAIVPDIPYYLNLFASTKASMPARTFFLFFLSFLSFPFLSFPFLSFPFLSFPFHS